MAGGDGVSMGLGREWKGRRQMVFSLLWNLTGSDPYEVNELGQSCRTSFANEGPAVVLGCNADASGRSWDTWKGKKTAVATLEPYWENPWGAPGGSTWGKPANVGTNYY
ncbi:hypothetical protein GUITHDRAFT_136129 [Guillardia theta CCMP2712]|uniref:Uncharacterized protein n=1 Tax=Guillardia theta (strain CCMP2712) TaxID=905079 RepID=L1JN15_GUITC|nr:hypothetical protein GUITHDRAFT_136129 [Guillardia theta CCMP2712]EKX49468.1 hypothetical protein GUITHDRAFT_136129 [Guillardia theta CCMP2712]|eukprot:XP_005836448.1 hypothetical protein GUITHDRAFT_136129 [Guillardia theta CCMP2712]